MAIQKLYSQEWLRKGNNAKRFYKTSSEVKIAARDRHLTQTGNRDGYEK